MEHKATDQNVLATRLSGFWTNFKQGKIISYRLMAIILVLIATIGVTTYILSERRTAASQRWMEEDEARSKEAQEDISKKYPGTIQDKLARLQVARALLGDSGIELLGSGTSAVRDEGVKNIETAREMIQKLLEDFKNDPVFKAECLLGLAKAEAALVGVPSTPGQLIEFKGKVPKVVEYLDQLSAAAAPETPWATKSKELADALRDEKSTTRAEFVAIQQAMFKLSPTGPELPKFDEPKAPGLPGGGPVPPIVPIVPR